jgi:hypothetical protein
MIESITLDELIAGLRHANSHSRKAAISTILSIAHHGMSLLYTLTIV